MAASEDLVLVVIVAQFKDEKKALNAALAAGAPGITYFYGRGTGVRQRLGILSQFIQKEKVVLLSAAPSSRAPAIVKAVGEAIEFDKPGRGFACVMKIDQVHGYL